MPGALDGLLVVSVEQAVAAPYCSARLADAGARVIKIERPEGDFARGYDGYVHGLSTYFVWLNRGKQSVTLDFKKAEDSALLQRLIGKADVLIQNLAPGAADRAGFGSAAMRAKNKRLITVDVSGYGDHGPYRNRRAYDLLVQAESGLASITGTEHAPGRVGISATDIGTGMYAHAAVLEARRAGDAGATQKIGAMVREQFLPQFIHEAALRTRVAVASDTPLVERLVQFWSNHFTVSVVNRPIVVGIANAYEREAIRPHQLGRFRDLLEAQATSVVMLDLGWVGGISEARKIAATWMAGPPESATVIPVGSLAATTAAAPQAAAAATLASYSHSSSSTSGASSRHSGSTTQAGRGPANPPSATNARASAGVIAK